MNTSPNTYFDFDFFKSLNIDIMFAASPKTAVQHKKYKSTKNSQIFYIIYGIYIEEKKEYLVYWAIIKKTVSKNQKLSFKELESDISFLTDKQQVLEHIYFFLNQFSKHERIIKDDIIQLPPAPAIEILHYLNEWVSWVYGVFSLKK